MCEPLFKIKDIIEKHNIKVLFSNGFVAQRFKRQHSAHLNRTQVITWV